MSIINILSSYGSKFSTLVFNSVIYSNSSTVTASGILPGDLLVLDDKATGSIAQTSNSIPSGFSWVSAANTGGNTNDVRTNLSYKIADGTETTLSGLAGGSTNKALAIFRGNAPISIAVVKGVVSFNSDLDPPSQTITSSAGASPLLVLGSFTIRDVTGVTGRSFSPSADGEFSANSTMYLNYKIYNTPPSSNIVIDMTDGGSRNTLLGAYIELS